MKSDCFSSKNGILLKKVCFKVSLCGKVVRLAYLTVYKWLVGDIPSNTNFVPKVNHPLAWQPCRSVLSGNLMNTLFASQWLECSMKFITMPIN